MKAFISLEFDSALSDEAARDFIAEHLPEFRWRRGDSDTQGLYISGVAPNGVRIMCWVGERPLSMSVSFRSASVAADAQESVLDAILKAVLPGLGAVTLLHWQPSSPESRLRS